MGQREAAFERRLVPIRPIPSDHDSFPWDSASRSTREILCSDCKILKPLSPVPSQLPSTLTSGFRSLAFYGMAVEPNTMTADIRRANNMLVASDEFIDEHSLIFTPPVAKATAQIGLLKGSIAEIATLSGNQ